MRWVEGPSFIPLGISEGQSSVKTLWMSPTSDLGKLSSWCLSFFLHIMGIFEFIAQEYTPRKSGSEMSEGSYF